MFVCTKNKKVKLITKTINSSIQEFLTIFCLCSSLVLVNYVIGISSHQKLATGDAIFGYCIFSTDVFFSRHACLHDAIPPEARHWRCVRIAREVLHEAGRREEGGGSSGENPQREGGGAGGEIEGGH